MGRNYNRSLTGQGQRTTQSLSDRDMLQDLLQTEKYLTEILNHAVLESSSDQTRQMFKTLQDNAQGHAQMIYDVMSENGWYNVGSAGQMSGQQISGGQQNRRYRTSGYGETLTAGVETNQQGGYNNRFRGKNYRGEMQNTMRRNGWQSF